MIAAENVKGAAFLIFAIIYPPFNEFSNDLIFNDII